VLDYSAFKTSGDFSGELRETTLAHIISFGESSLISFRKIAMALLSFVSWLLVSLPAVDR
jgi:hypothetical protein